MRAAGSSAGRGDAETDARDRSGFEREVRDGLSHLHDPGHLQSHPLTRYLEADSPARPSSAGRALRQCLLDAIESTKPSADLPPTRHASRAYQILRLRYVEALEVSQVLDRLSISESLYYLELQRAIEGLSAVLSERWSLDEAGERPEKQAARGVDGKIVSAVQGRQAGRAEAVEGARSNLPLQLTSFVGREREIAEVKRLVDQNRLLTLTGTGGCGKTRLALQVGQDLLADTPISYPDGVWLVDLAPLSDPGLVPQTVAFTLGLRGVPGEPILTTLQSYLKSKRLLLLLDNCEHLLDASARLADVLLRACPNLRILATSREALGITGETSYRVPSLSLPDPEHPPSFGDLAEYESVRLFVDRAKSVQQNFALGEGNAPTVARICWRLDGMPLAIELAAARLRGLTVEQIARHLDDRFRLLTGGSRTALRRQQTLRATVDWSYDLLSEPERILFRRLSVFSGGWSLDAAEEVCADEQHTSGTQTRVERGEVLDVLLRLVDRSLVVAEEVGEEGRYSFTETVRQYAQEKLLDSGEMAKVRDQHRDWFLNLAAWPPDLPPMARRMRAQIDRLEIEYDNLRSALSWCLETAPGLGLELVASQPIYHFWLSRGYPAEARYWNRELLARAPERTITRARALEHGSWYASDQGDLDEAARLAEESLEIAREAGDARATIWALISLAQVAGLRGDHESERALEEEALALARRAGEPALTFGPLHWLGGLCLLQGDYRRARELAEENLETSRLLGNEAGMCVSSSMLGRIEREEGNYARARTLLEEAVATAREFGDLSVLGSLAASLGYVVGREGEYDRGVSLLRESLLLRQRLGQRPRLGHCLCLLAILQGGRGAHARAARLISAGLMVAGVADPDFSASERVDQETCLAAARSGLGEEAFSRAWAEGQAMSLDQAVEYALQDEGLSAASATD